MPFTVTSQPKARRSTCSSATSDNTKTATVVKGFTRNLLYVGQRWYAATQGLRGPNLRFKGVALHASFWKHLLALFLLQRAMESKR